MHELGIAFQIIKIVQNAIPDDAEKARVVKVCLNVGKLSTVEPESLRFCFGAASRESRMEGAELVINEIPTMIRCRECRHEWTTDDFLFRCPACDGGSIQVVSGREFGVESIEIQG